MEHLKIADSPHVGEL